VARVLQVGCYDSLHTQQYAKLEVEYALFPLKEAVYGAMKHTYVKRPWQLVEECLQGQGHFRHVFEPVRQEDVVHTIPDPVDRYWATARADKAA
jgi:pyruvate ferredoxin oxidoreductase beta subunit